MGVIVTTGLPHSGTTILNLLIGSHSRHVAVGEAYGMLSSEEQLKEAFATGKRCSCGAPAPECDLWGPFLRSAFRNNYRTHHERYRLFLEHAGELGIPVDSSKEIKGTEQEFTDARFVFVVKDVRSWAVAHQLRAQKQGRKPITLPRLFLRWHKNVHRRLRDLEGIRHTTVGYDPLAMRPAAVLPRVCDWLGIPFEDSMLTPDLRRSHALRGNGPLLYFKRSAVQYDDRWLSSNAWAPVSALLPWVMWENTRLVWKTGGPGPVPTGVAASTR